jgi:hypothetical protein
MPITKETRDEKGYLHSFNDEPAVIWDNGSMYWYQHGNVHRDNDLPAVIFDHGSKVWYRHGKKHGLRHRDNDEPAVIWSDGDMYWFKHGKLHRETDAALISLNGNKEYWLNGINYNFEQWLKLTPLPEEDKIALLLEK